MKDRDVPRTPPSDAESLRRLSTSRPDDVASWERKIRAAVEPYLHPEVPSFVLVDHREGGVRFVVKEHCVVTVLPARARPRDGRLAPAREQRREERAVRAEMRLLLGPVRDGGAEDAHA